MGKLLRLSNIKNEKHIIDNWFKVRLPRGCFGIVAGDLVLRMLTLDDQKHLLRKISSWLCPGGYLILRVKNKNYFNSKQDKLRFSIDAFFDKYEGELNQFQLEDLLMLVLFDKHVDYNNEFQVETNKVFLEIEKLKVSQTKNYRIKILDNVLRKWSRDSDWTHCERVNIERLIRNYYITENRKHASDYIGSDNFSIYFLRKP